jgi:hypothetical protein
VNIAGVEIFRYVLATLVGLLVGTALGIALRRLAAPRSDDLPTLDPQGLESRLAALEDLQTRREIEWRETKDQISRHLKRAAAVEARSKDGRTPVDDLSQQLLEMKLRRSGG